MKRWLIPPTVALLCLVAAPTAAAAPDWLSFRTLNITHQGGEDEAPSATMYAFDRSMRLGADMLEVDVHVTQDGEIVVLHDGSVDRTTNGSGSIYDMTLAQAQRLDAAHDFVPGVGATPDAPPRHYAFRGVRTGEKPPPPGFRPRDFRIPTLREVMRAYPQVPINIEIKGESDENRQSFLDNAEHLARFLNGLGRTRGIIVASFDDAALARFHQLAPQIDLAPATAETAAFVGAGVPPGPGRVAFQVPITFEGVQVTDADFVRDAHAEGLAVHVWLSSDPENDDVYRRLLDWNVDGVMPAAPAAFERVLCARDVARPRRPAGLPGKHCNHKRVSIACDVAPVGVGEMGRGGRVRVRLKRRDNFDGGCGGLVAMRVAGEIHRKRFQFGRCPPSAGGPEARSVKIRLTGDERRAVAQNSRSAHVETRAYQAYGDRESFRLRAK